MKTNIDQIFEINKDDFDHWFGDWDGDGLANIDDPNPLIPGDTEPIDSAELKPQLTSLIEQKNEYIPALKTVMQKLIDMKFALAVKGRVKTMYSTLGKLIRKRFPFTEKIATAKGETYTTGLTDIAGCMAVLDGQAELDKMVERILNGEIGKVWEHEDKYENPTAGYRAHHFIIVTSGKIPVEVQVKTKRMSIISAASHFPYKNGELNGNYLLKLTDLAWQADQGDKGSTRELDPFLSDLDQLQKDLTLRENPPAELATLRESFQDTIGKLALAFQLDKFPEEHRQEALDLFRDHGQIIGVDFDGLFEKAQKQSKTDDSLLGATKDKPLIGKFKSRRSDIELSGFKPIAMTKGERRQANEKALAVLKKEDRAITASDIDDLRQYTGAGGIGYGDSDDQKDIRGLLNEHYTSYPIAQMMWDKLQQMGVTHGNILEPGAGVGNFAGFVPDRDKIKMLMVERSAISSRIAHLLYPQQEVRHEDFGDTDLSIFNISGAIGNVPFGDIKIHGRRDSLAPLNPRIHDYFILKSLDALLPGGFLAMITSIGTMDKKDPAIRQAMTSRAMFVGAYRLPSTAFKDNADTYVTTDILIFQKYEDHDGQVHPDAGSERNRLFAYEPLIESAIERKGETYSAFYNPYYDQYPDHVLGDHIQGHHVQFFSRMGVKGQISQSLIDSVVGDGLRFPYDLPADTTFYNIPDDGVMLPTGRDYHAGNIVFYEGDFYEKQRKFYKPVKIGHALQDKVESACRLLDKYDDFVTALAQESADKQALREEFKERLIAHIEHFGIPDEDNDIRGEFKYDNRLYKLTTFAKRDAISGELVYADIIEAQSMFNSNYVPSVEDSADLSALASYGRSVGETLDIDFYQSVYQGGTATKGELIGALESHPDFFLDPESDRYEFRYEYLSGNVRKKLEAARQAGIEKNIEALESVLPAWIDVFNITVDPQHVFTYLPPRVVSEWITDEMNYDKVEFGLVKDMVEVGNRFTMRMRKWGTYVKNGEQTPDDFNMGWGETPFTTILKKYISNHTFPLKFYDEQGGELPGMSIKKAERMGNDGQILIERARKIQRQNNSRMLVQVPKKLNTWVRTKASSEVRDMIEKAYNGQYNATINPPFDGRTLRVRGMSDTFYGVKDFTVYKHNRAVAEKLVWNGRGANCHDVGAGKTLASIITSQVLLQQGSARKPMFVVPGKVQEKWVEEYLMLFPDAKILNMKMKADSKFKELTMAQLYNWDAIFIADHAFKALSLSPDVKRQMLEDRMEYFRGMLEDFETMLDEDDAFSSTAKKSMKKRLAENLEKWSVKLRDAASAKRLETDIYFDELGVDCLFFDEAHFYKNAIGSAKAEKLGIAASKPSQRAEDALQKTKWLFNKTNNRNVFVLTATPVVNSPIEVWHMLNLCAPDLLDTYKISNLDNFINLFVQLEEKIVKKTSGEYKSEEVVSGYYNLPEMRTIIDEVMDIKSYDQLIGFYKDFPDYVRDTTGEIINGTDGNPKLLTPQFKRPEGNIRHQTIEPSGIHELLFDDIILRANEVLACMKDRQCETKDNFLVITGDGSKIATDLRVYDNDFEGVNLENLKLGQLIGNVTASYKARPNPAPAIVAEDIYGDYFNRPGHQRIRENSESPIRNQIIFCDWISTQGGRPGSFHTLIKNELVKAGIPKKQIAIINGSIIGTHQNGSDYTIKGSDDKEALKKDVQDDFNSGLFRILIGNQSIAEGMNLQKWTTDLHHLDVPYTPSQIQQRNGRGLRQGNQYPNVDIHFYLMKDSFDQYRLELVSKKQNWIDDLFFGTERQVSTDSDSGSLEYEQMVAATNSDRRVKKFFQARSNMKLLDDKIENLDGEVSRIEAGMSQMKLDMERSRKNISAAMEKEKALQQSHLPPSGKQALSEKRITIEFGYGGEPSRINLELSSEPRRIAAFRMKTELDVPENNANGRVLFYLIPDSDPSRDFYNRSSWSAIKRMAQQELGDIFGWSLDEKTGQGRSITGNLGNIIASEDDFYSFHGVDLEAEKEKNRPDGSKQSFRQIKDKIGMFQFQSWEGIITARLADLFVALETAWQRGAQGRIALQEKQVQQKTKTLGELGKNHVSTKADLSRARKDRERDTKTIAELQNIVNEIVAVAYDDRNELYEEINRIAPGFGVKKTINVRDVGSLSEGNMKPKVNRGIDEGLGGLPGKELRENSSLSRSKRTGKKLPRPLKTLYEDPLVYAGIVKELEMINTDGYMERLEAESDDLAMVINADGTTIFVFPTRLMKLSKGSYKEPEAAEMFEDFHHFPADDYDYELFPPQGEKLLSAGHADRIMYVSDKVIYADDEKGKDNHYFHYFDTGQRPVYKYGDIYIIANVTIDGRGILN